MKTNPFPRFSTWLALALAAAIALGGRAAAQQVAPVVPASVNYQGKLTDGSGGLPADGLYDIQFRVWSDATGGTVVWGQTYTVHVQSGYFNVVLGGPGGTAIAGASQSDITQAFSDSARYLGLTITKDVATGTINNPQEISPRQQFLSSPYALKAQSASDSQNLAGKPASSYLATTGGSVGNLAVTGTLGVSQGATFSGAAQINSSLTVKGGNFSIQDSGGNQMLGFDTSAGVSGFGIIPIGGIIMWSGSSVPSGWALCDGGSSNGHQTPDLRNRFIVGSGSSYSVGNTGGSTSIILSAANLPPHTHSYMDNAFTLYSTTWRGGGSSSPGNGTGGSSSSSSNTGNGPGASSPINITPPYYALAFIMRVR